MNTTDSGQQFAIGLDYGSTTVRCLIVDLETGDEAGVGTYDYPSGVEGVITDPANPHVARQNPADFIAGTEAATRAALAQAAGYAGFATDRIVGIGVDATGSTPMPVDHALQPLALKREFAGRRAAMAWMWKDHSSIDEAERITAIAAETRPHYLARCGGAYSSEWFFAKIWHCFHEDGLVFDAASTWVEFCDFIPAMLAGVTRIDELKRNVCVAGHKGLYCPSWGGWPDAEFLRALNPVMARLLPTFGPCQPIGQPAGTLCADWAARLGLPAGIPISMGALDAHMGAVGAGVGTGRMVKVIGTSSCDLLVAPPELTLTELPGVCGIVVGSVLPGVLAVEAGQAAVGDILNWYVKEQCRGDAKHFATLTAEAAALAPGQSGLLALDWHNGNRNILVDARLTGLMLGFTLRSSQADVFRALIEATAFGARREGHPRARTARRTRRPAGGDQD
jgi:L-ribulokinase